MRTHTFHLQPLAKGHSSWSTVQLNGHVLIHTSTHFKLVPFCTSLAVPALPDTATISTLPLPSELSPGLSSAAAAILRFLLTSLHTSSSSEELLLSSLGRPSSSCQLEDIPLVNEVPSPHTQTHLFPFLFLHHVYFLFLLLFHSFCQHRMKHLKFLPRRECCHSTNDINIT